MPTGWRPEDVSKQYPVYKIEDVYHFSKYETPASPGFATWIWVQMLILLLMLIHFFGNIASIGSPGIFWYGGYVFLSVYAYTELMDRNQRAWLWDLCKAGYVGFILWQTGDWFGLSSRLPGVIYWLIAYHLFSVSISYVYSKSFQNSAATAVG